jgi:hypothetical protein
MRWDKGGDYSANVEDRRGQPAARRLPAGKLTLGTLVLLLIGAFLGQDLLSGGGAPGTTTASAPTGGAAGAAGARGDDELARFTQMVFQDTQKLWKAHLGPLYRDAKLVLFTDATDTACGLGEAAMGPFYCPGDDRVYIDLGFYHALDRRLGAPGDFAQAYVIAHEMGHHVQNLRGDNARVASASERDPARANQLSVRLELQADCLAGVWAHDARARQILEIGDVEEALGAATAVGDDTLQRRGGGRVAPETWTHGSAAQRVAWFERGLASGRFGDCDTFGGPP